MKRIIFKLLPSAGVSVLLLASLANSATTAVGTNGYLAGGQGTPIELQYTSNGQFLPLSFVGTIFGY